MMYCVNRKTTNEPNIPFFKILRIFIYLFLTVLDLRCCMGFSLVVVCRLVSAVAFLVMEYRL